jgi:hypothetical protein
VPGDDTNHVARTGNDCQVAQPKRAEQRVHLCQAGVFLQGILKSGGIRNWNSCGVEVRLLLACVSVSVQEAREQRVHLCQAGVLLQGKSKSKVVLQLA